VQGAALAIVNVIRNNGSDIYDMERFIILREKQKAAAAGSDVVNLSRASVSADGEIGEISISELREGEDGIDDDDDNDDNAQYCIPCATIRTVADDNGVLSFNQKALQRYVLHCAQDVEKGGLRDKPGKSRDFYHSCYSLSGLSISQSFHISSGNSHITSSDGDEDTYFTSHVFGDTSNLLKSTSCVFNIGLEKLEFALKYFGNMPSTHNKLLS
jgi:Prenyltransferase and squalene oxidase repeat